MVIQSSNLNHQSPGLLPTPTRQLISEKTDSFVGRSYYPLPFPLTTVLEGSQLTELISWDTSVSSNHLKLKLEWSTVTKESNSSVPSDIIPRNILQAINFYNLIQPSWSTSCAKNKLSTKIEWKISPSKLNQPGSNYPTSNVVSSLNKTPNLYSPSSKNVKNSNDSGFGSSNSNLRIHGNSFNWRRSVNLPPNPNFDSPRLKSNQHNIFVPPKCKEVKASNNLSKKPPISPTNPEKFTSPSFAQDIKPVNKKPDNSDSQGKTQNPHNPIQNNASSQSSSVQNSVSSNIPLKVDDASANQAQNKTTITDASSIPVFVDGIPIAPKGFPKKFLTTPNPLPIVGDGYLDPKTAAYFMDIQGTCRLCDSPVKSYLVDLHLLNCSGLERKPLDSFVKSSMKEFSMKKKQVVEASILFSKFELNEVTVLNKYFKKVDKYRSFALKVENLTKLLTNEAFKKLNISPKLDTYNILKFQA